jgi:predicted HAD superfamily Cof-like phosphohydrolase
MTDTAIIPTNQQDTYGAQRRQILWQLTQRNLFQVYKDFPEGAEKYTTQFGTVTTKLIAAVTLARRLIDEEVNKDKELLPSIDKWLANPSIENLEGVMDGVIDVLYVMFELCYALDLPVMQAFAEVHAANMAKLQRGEDGQLLRREDGKILKPTDWKEPNILMLLLDHSNLRAAQHGLHGAENWALPPTVQGAMDLNEG